MRRDGDGRFGPAVVRFVGRREGTHGNGEGAVDGIRTRVCADGAVVFDGGGETGTNDRAPGHGGGGSPREGVWVDAMLVRVSCGWIRDALTV